MPTLNISVFNLSVLVVLSLSRYSSKKLIWSCSENLTVLFSLCRFTESETLLSKLSCKGSCTLLTFLPLPLPLPPPLLLLLLLTSRSSAVKTSSLHPPSSTAPARCKRRNSVLALHSCGTFLS